MQKLSNKKMNPEEALKLHVTQLAKEESKNFSNTLRACDVALIYYILKTTTDREHPLSNAEIAEQLDWLIPAPISSEHYFSERTISRKMVDTLGYLSKSKNPIINSVPNILSTLMGGSIRSRNVDKVEKSPRKKKDTTSHQLRYYFEPFLSDSDMNLVYGAIESSRYLSDEEKEYLSSRLKYMHPGLGLKEGSLENNKNRNILEIDKLPARPEKDTDRKLPDNSSTFLSNTQIIHDAIVHEYELEVVYGTYDTRDNLSKVAFHATNADKPYILNPYALFWNDGKYYMIATHQGHSNVAHFRIDRIVSVTAHKITNEDGYVINAPRSPIPTDIKEYFKSVAGGPLRFDSISYVNHYPKMHIHYDEKVLDNVTFECTPRQLQTLIDNFGPNIELHQSTKEHTTDTNNEDAKYITATIHKIHYDSALAFSISHCGYLTLIDPPELIEDLKDNLKNIINKYE